MTPGLTVRLSESPLVLGRPAGRAGSDAESILAEVGLAGRMAELSRFWVLRTPIICRPLVNARRSAARPAGQETASGAVTLMSVRTSMTAGRSASSARSRLGRRSPGLSTRMPSAPMSVASRARSTSV